MANQDQLNILKQGYMVWNKWRELNPNVNLDFSKADLKGCNLLYVDLLGGDLREANLSEANLGGSTLIGANFRGAILTNADLQNAELEAADFTEANLLGANLREANLGNTNFLRANLIASDLRGVYLRGANLEGALIGVAAFGDIDLSETFGLEEVISNFPATLGTDTIKLSKGKIPEAFLRACGLSDWEIESTKLHNPDLTNEGIAKIQYRIYDLRATQALQISPLFISYSHADNTFVHKLEENLNAKGVRFWRDIHDATAGRLETQIDRAIRQNPIVLLILSKNSISSDWVQHEIRKARELEKELGRDVLCPIALDDSWKKSNWPQRIIEQIMEYNILDFSVWEDKTAFNSKFTKLLSGLDLFYKKPKAKA